MKGISETELGKISQVFAGKAQKTNKQILAILALEGPQTPYGLFKKQNEHTYPVINVRMRALTEGGYLKIIGSETALKSKQQIKRYGLTLKGLILSLLLDEDCGKKKRVLYEGMVRQILDSNSANVSFCKFFANAISRGALDETIVKDIFFDKLREYVSKGYINVDVINDYFLFKHAGAYILHFAQEQIDNLPEETRTLVGQVLIEFRRLSHPETTSRFLDPYLP